MRPILGRASSSNTTSDTLRGGRSPSPIPDMMSAFPPPTIRLVSGNPSAAGSASVGNDTFASSAASTSFASSYVNVSPVSSPGLSPRNEETRRKLVPKKSKLGLLGGTTKTKERGRDMSDMVRRVGGTNSTRGGFEIYVDPAPEPEAGEVLMIQKKKSRGGLNALGWGGNGNGLSDTTNTAGLKPKNDVKEKEKWWSIGRGKKETKDKENPGKTAESVMFSARSKGPSPLSIEIDEPASRNRFNSLDSGVMLNEGRPAASRSRSVSSSQLLTVPDLVSDAGSPMSGPEELLQTPTLLSAPNPATGSIAVRAMRSMRSLAHMTSWAQLGPKEPEAPQERPAEVKDTKDKGTKKGKKKVLKTKKDDGRKATLRNPSGSSFEAGTPLTPELATFGEAAEQPKRKPSMLGIGLPSTKRFGSARLVSTSSSVNSTGLPQPPATMRLSSSSSTHLDANPARYSAGSSINLDAHSEHLGRGRPASSLSANSSLRPASTASGSSGGSSAGSRISSSSAVSVRWDDRALETLREERRQERAVSAETRASGHTAEGRKRAAINDIFPESMPPNSRPVSGTSSMPNGPMIAIEEATTDGHSISDRSAFSTPPRRRRARPISEQMPGQERPKAICDDGDSDAVLSILDAATNELASLISRLDLEATPATPDGTPIRISPELREILRNRASPMKPGSKALGSPVPTRKTRNSLGPTHSVRGSTASITSLRPYAQSRAQATIAKANVPVAAAARLGMQIAPWPVSPEKEEIKPLRPIRSNTEPLKIFKPAQTRPLSPIPAEESSQPVFRPLQPASRSKVPALAKRFEGRMSTPPSAVPTPAPSSAFGIKTSTGADKVKPAIRGPGPVFRPAPLNLHETKDSFSSLFTLGDSRMEMRSPIIPEARKDLGLAGTLGGSVATVDMDRELESSDPDSDVPDELRDILQGGNTYRRSIGIEDTLSYGHSRSASVSSNLPSPGAPPKMPLPMPEIHVEDEDVEMTVETPMFRTAPLNDHDHLAVLDGAESGDDDTKRSFDFTGELRALNESGGSDRLSFVEQLENAFKTPAKVNLANLGHFALQDVPPMPAMPMLSPSQEDSDSLMPSACETQDDSLLGPESSPEKYPASSLLASPEISMPRRERSSSSSYDISFPRAARSRSNTIDGELNLSFKFGGKSPIEDSFPVTEPSKELTLSDIIPPPEIQNRLSMASLSSEYQSEEYEDDSVLKSILAKAGTADDMDIPPVPPLPISEVPRRRALSDASMDSRRLSMQEESFSYRDSFSGSMHSRRSSQASFSGFDSFDEVRRGFEFANLSSFYPPPDANPRGHATRESVFSIASVSSYGVVLNPGVADPFEYGRYDLPSRPSSDGLSLSMSMTVDDTFDFMHRDSRRRQRVDSDASSFYFRPPPPVPAARPRSMHVTGRAHRRNESNMSVGSMAPPVSLYNRSFGAHARHGRNDSVSSIGSSAHQFAFGSQRMSWGPRPGHRAEHSMDSMMSDFSAMRVARPGLSGDKMLESAQGMPLTAISASPPESLRSARFSDPYEETGRFAIDDATGRYTYASGQERSSAEYDSIMDTRAWTFANTGSSAVEDSIFDRTGANNRTSVSSESLFGGNELRPHQARGQFTAMPRYRPVSIYSINEDSESARENDTMVTMLDGGHVRRSSVDSVVGGSPLARAGGKRKHAAIRSPMDNVAGSDGEIEHMEMPNKARLVEARLMEKPSATESLRSVSSNIFGTERMGRAHHGHYHRQSLEENCLEASGEDLSMSIALNSSFTRPGRTGRSRSSTYSSSSETDTPPLSVCDSESNTSGSQSSIDLAGLNLALSNMTHPVTARTRLRPGHRRVRGQRQSVYETIQEETASPTKDATVKMVSQGPMQQDDVMVVDDDNTLSLDWDDERNVVALRRYFALREEAQITVEDSRRMWHDTPFSVYALQSFNPPLTTSDMRALLEHSQQNYGPLPSELRAFRIRSRTSSRVSPYQAARAAKMSSTSSSASPAPVVPVFTAPAHSVFTAPEPVAPSVLKDRTANTNTPHAAQGKKSKKHELPDVSPFAPENMSKLSNGLPRARVNSNSRRNNLGWAKRSNGKENKENGKTAVGTGATPGETSFRRPRPRGRPTPARTAPLRG
ncbi:hypothetical protein PENSPDRAFT_342582 [Peniophora sp. CONT]|nr:hypothetical protein PENSPDRAFT_342582 [Peniophora sp. CONT]